MSIPFNTLLEESKCYLCLGISQAEAMQLALLNRIATAGGGSGGSYLSYVATLSQAGVAPPVATVLNNTLGGTPVWSYLGVGIYRVTLTGAFTLGKTWVTITAYNDPTSAVNTAGTTVENANSILVITGDPTTGTGQDGYLFETAFEIRVYP